VADDEMFAAAWRGAVVERADLAVGSADADVEHAYLDLILFRNLWFVMLDQRNLLIAWKNRDGFHRLLLVLPGIGAR